MVEYTVYLDIVFLINFMMDYLILWGTAKFTGFTTTLKKLFISASIGALYSLAVFLPNFHFLITFFMKLLFSALMVYIAYYPHNKKKFLRALGYFYLVACAAGGSMLGTIYLFGSTAILSVINGLIIATFDVKVTFLIVAVCTIVLIGLFGARVLMNKNFLNNSLFVPIIIKIADKEFAVKALVDTGNNLRDPISGLPVVVIELNVLKDLFSKEIYVNDECDFENIYNCLDHTYLAKRIRIIPFSSVGKKKGLLVGIRPDEMIISYQKKSIKISSVIIGVYNKTLSTDGYYRALLHPELLQNSVSI